jgi:hypothetical protein
VYTCAKQLSGACFTAVMCMLSYMCCHVICNMQPPFQLLLSFGAQRTHVEQELGEMQSGILSNLAASSHASKLNNCVPVYQLQIYGCQLATSHVKPTFHFCGCHRR